MLATQITSRDFRLTPAIRAEVRGYVSKLEKLYRRMQRCEVTISTPHRRHRKGKLYHVSVRLQVPGSDLVVNRQAEEDLAHESLRLALHDAFRSLERQLKADVRETRGFVKAHETRTDLLGHVKSLFPDQNYGMLESEDGTEVYFHRHSLKGAGLDSLQEGTAVYFQPEEGDKGLQAKFVRLRKKPRRAASARAA